MPPPVLAAPVHASDQPSKTFYLETFGCQMNVHDSEKVIGTLESQGYAQVQTEEAADLILYNTCSIRDKAEQKVFNRLNDYKKLHKQGKRFGVLGCVAQQEGERIFERAPYVSLVSGSASYRKLPEMLVQLEAGKTRITGLDDRQTDETFVTEFTARSNPHRGYITIVEGCDKFCAYCVVPYTRGKERSRTSISVLEEARRMADSGYTEIQLLGQNVNSYRDPEGRFSFADLLAAVGQISGIRRVRFTTSHPRDFTREIVQAIDSVPALCDHVHLPVQSGSTRVLGLMAREYTRDWYLERISWIKAAAREISMTTDIIVGFPGETEADFEETLEMLAEVNYDAVFAFKYSPRPNTPAITMADSIPETEKVTRLQVLLDRQRELQRTSYARHVGQVLEVMVEGHNPARGQVTSRTTQKQDAELHHHAADPACSRKLRSGPGHSVPPEQPGRGTDSRGADGREWSRQPGGKRMDVEMKIRGLMVDPSTQQPIVILKDLEGNTVLPIWVGLFEASAIALEVEKATTPRPMTHDLLRNMIQGLNAQVQRVVVSELRNDTFFAVIWLEQKGEVITIDARPSDALALALRSDCPIFVSEDVLRTAKVIPNPADQATPEDLKNWLENLNDEDLGRYKM